MTATPKFFFVHTRTPAAVFAIAENAHFTPPFAIAMEAAWRVIFSGAQPRGKWLCVNDDSDGAFSLRPYFAGPVALTTETFAKLVASRRRTRGVQVQGERLLKPDRSEGFAGRTSRGLGCRWVAFGHTAPAFGVADQMRDYERSRQPSEAVLPSEDDAAAGSEDAAAGSEDAVAAGSDADEDDDQDDDDNSDGANTDARDDDDASSSSSLLVLLRRRVQAANLANDARRQLLTVFCAADREYNNAGPPLIKHETFVVVLHVTPCGRQNNYWLGFHRAAASRPSAGEDSCGCPKIERHDPHHKTWFLRRHPRRHHRRHRRHRRRRRRRRRWCCRRRP